MLYLFPGVFILKVLAYLQHLIVFRCPEPISCAFVKISCYFAARPPILFSRIFYFYKHIIYKMVVVKQTLIEYFISIRSKTELDWSEIYTRLPLQLLPPIVGRRESCSKSEVLPELLNELG